jgi:hypothetical protein
MRILLFACSLFIIISCNNKKEDEFITAVKGKTLIELPVSAERITGTYIGDFKGSPVSITLNYVYGGHASGYNIHKGLKRNITGTIELQNNQLHLQLEEPGNNPYDGKFDLVIDTATWKGKGNWKPLKKGDEVSFSFQKQRGWQMDGDLDPFSSIYMNEGGDYIQLNTDGSCIYSYMTDSTKTAQSLSIRGNYSLSKDSTLSIFWQKNDVFPSGKSAFRMKMDHPDGESDYRVMMLKGDKKTFSQMMY